MSEFVHDFCEGYFARNPPPGPDGFQSREERLLKPVQEGEREAIDTRYRKFVHHQVVTTEEALNVLTIASHQTDDHERTVVRLPCICRHRAYGDDKQLRCYGIAFTSEYTKRFPDYLGGRHSYESPTTILDVLEELIHSESVVHAVSALGVPYIGLLCNCDMNICSPYINRLRLGVTSTFHKGHYAAIIDQQKCIGCGACESFCPFGVANLDDISSLALIDPEQCYGCGICERKCPEGAISLNEVFRETGF